MFKAIEDINNSPDKVQKKEVDKLIPVVVPRIHGQVSTVKKLDKKQVTGGRRSSRKSESPVRKDDLPSKTTAKKTETIEVKPKKREAKAAAKTKAKVEKVEPQRTSKNSKASKTSKTSKTSKASKTSKTSMPSKTSRTSRSSSKKKVVPLEKAKQASVDTGIETVEAPSSNSINKTPSTKPSSGKKTVEPKGRKSRTSNGETVKKLEL